MPVLPVAGLPDAADAVAGAALPAGKKDSPERVLDAARQFESLLMSQMLRSMRESGSGWLGTGADGAGSIATEFAEQQFASALSAQGGLGLASLIAAGLERER